MKDRRDHVRAWAELLRLPNLPTLPGDVLAGYLATGTGNVRGDVVRLTAALAISLLLYVAGLLLNDWVDVETDRRERPSRPLPSGRVSIHAAASVAVFMALVALLVAVGMGGRLAWVTWGLAGLIALYHTPVRRCRLAGALLMGGCRALNVMLGAAVADGGWMGAPVWMAAVLIGGTIVAISLVAANEADGQPAGPARGLTVLPVLLATGVWSYAGCWPAALLGVVAAADYARTAHAAGLPGADVPRQVGRWIRGLTGLQAACCIMIPSPAGFGAAVSVLLMRPLSARLGRRIHGS